MSVELQRSDRVTAADANMLILATEKQVFGFDLLETFRVAIGRHDSNDLSFDSRSVSNYHAEILCEADAVTCSLRWRSTLMSAPLAKAPSASLQISYIACHPGTLLAVR